MFLEVFFPPTAAALCAYDFLRRYIGTLATLNLEEVRLTGCSVGDNAKGGAIALNTHQLGHGERSRSQVLFSS